MSIVIKAAEALYRRDKGLTTTAFEDLPSGVQAKYRQMAAIAFSMFESDPIRKEDIQARIDGAAFHARREALAQAPVTETRPAPDYVDLDDAAIAAARSDATFDGRTFDSMGKADRDRYLARARKAVSAALSAGGIVGGSFVGFVEVLDGAGDLPKVASAAIAPDAEQPLYREPWPRSLGRAVVLLVEPLSEEGR